MIDTVKRYVVAEGELCDEAPWANNYTDLAHLVKASDYDALAARVAELEAENARLAGILDGVELIAVNDKTGCRSCTAVVNAIVTEQPNRAVYERAHAAEQRAARAEAERDALKQANADLLQAANRRIAVQRAERAEAELKKAEGYLWEILYCPMPKTSSKSYVMRIPKELLSTINAFARRNKEGQ